LLRFAWVVLLVVLPVAAVAQTRGGADSTQSVPVGADRWFAQDKIHHFAASGFLSGMGYYLARQQNGISSGRAAGVGIGISMVFGAAKELRDIGHGTPSWKDLVADLAGAVTVALLIRGM